MSTWHMRKLYSGTPAGTSFDRCAGGMVDTGGIGGVGMGSPDAGFFETGGSVFGGSERVPTLPPTNVKGSFSVW